MTVEFSLSRSPLVSALIVKWASKVPCPAPFLCQLASRFPKLLRPGISEDSAVLEETDVICARTLLDSGTLRDAQGFVTLTDDEDLIGRSSLAIPRRIGQCKDHRIAEFSTDAGQFGYLQKTKWT